MAEFVQFRFEEMMPELEQLEKLKLFEKHEVKGIAQQRKDHEFKIQKRTKCKDDYLRYIQYEMDLLKLIRVKRERMGITTKKNECDVVIANRINKIFYQVLLKFQEDVKLWLSFIKFCKQEKMYSSVSRMLERMLRVHHNKPSMWKLAANWEYEDCGSIERARQFLLQGLRHHPESSMLYLEAFRLELMNAATLRKKAAEETEAAAVAAAAAAAEAAAQCPVKSTLQQILSTHTQGSQTTPSSAPPKDEVSEGKLAEVIYDTAMKKVQGVEFIVNVLSLTTNFDFTLRLQERIVNDLLNLHPNDELTWDIMAKRELEGLTYSNLSSAAVEQSATIPSATKSPTGQKNKQPTRDQIKLCCEVYDAAVKQIKSDKMWSMYLDALVELNQDMEHLPRYKRNLLLSALQGAHSANCLPEKFYLQWIEMLQSMNKVKKIASVLRAATERLNSVELWTARLRLYLNDGDDKQGQSVFDQAIAKLGDTMPCLSIWKIMLQYYQVKKSGTKVESIFKSGLARGPEISCVLKPMYLEWIVLTKGITPARKVYDEISIIPPHCLEIHTKMAQLEGLQPEQNVKQTRKCYELACDQFGKTNADVWMEYVKFEMKKGNTINMTSIHFRATKTLESSQADIFVSEYSLLKTSMTS